MAVVGHDLKGYSVFCRVDAKSFPDTGTDGPTTYGSSYEMDSEPKLEFSVKFRGGEGA